MKLFLPAPIYIMLKIKSKNIDIGMKQNGILSQTYAEKKLFVTYMYMQKQI